MCNPFKEVQHAFNSVVNTVGSAGQSLINSVNNIAKNPLPVIETVALTYALGPEGYALASAANAPIIAPSIQ